MLNLTKPQRKLLELIAENATLRHSPTDPVLRRLVGFGLVAVGSATFGLLTVTATPEGKDEALRVPLTPAQLELMRECLLHDEDTSGFGVDTFHYKPVRGLLTLNFIEPVDGFTDHYKLTTAGKKRLALEK